MIEFFRDPILSGIGSLASIASLLIYLYFERERIFAKPTASIEHILDVGVLMSHARFGMVLGLLLNLSALLQTLSFMINEIPVFWWIGRVVFYLTMVVSCAVFVVEWKNFDAWDLRGFIGEILERLTYSLSFALPVMVFTLFFFLLQPDVTGAIVSSLMPVIGFFEAYFG
jgi:hypothetical protein